MIAQIRPNNVSRKRFSTGEVTMQLGICVDTLAQINAILCAATAAPPNGQVGDLLRAAQHLAVDAESRADDFREQVEKGELVSPQHGEAPASCSNKATFTQERYDVFLSASVTAFEMLDVLTKAIEGVENEGALKAIIGNVSRLNQLMYSAVCADDGEVRRALKDAGEDPTGFRGEAPAGERGAS